eukprot:4194665-Prymnesium_polylepis.1
MKREAGLAKTASQDILHKKCRHPNRLPTPSPREAGEAGEERNAEAPRLRAALREQHGLAPLPRPGLGLP